MNFDNYTPKELHALVARTKVVFGYPIARILQRQINRHVCTEEKKTLEPHPNPALWVTGGDKDKKWGRY